MMTQADKGRIFRELHQRDGAFIIPNPWDAGTARLLAHLGFEALATTSMGYAFSVGRRDNTIGRDETMAYASAMASATNLPVSADLENGFGDSPEIAAETIRLAAAAESWVDPSKTPQGVRIIRSMNWSMRWSGFAQPQLEPIPFPLSLL